MPDVVNSAYPAVPEASSKQVPLTPAKPKPTEEFQYLNRKYTLDTPTCSVPQLSEVFKSVYQRYDIAVTNREKVDEALVLFKQVLEVDLEMPLEECFTTWKAYLVNPRFIIRRNETSGDVKEITVRADEIPKERRKAQKHIRDLLDACQLYLQQKDFLLRHIHEDLSQLEHFGSNLEMLAKDTQLSSSERKQLVRLFGSAREQFSKFPEVVEKFWSQIYSLSQEVNTAVQALQS